MNTKTIMAFAVGTLLAAKGFAQGTIYVSNLADQPFKAAAVGSDGWYAEAFYTGTNPEGYVLNSVQLLMASPTGSPDGFAVMIYEEGASGEPSSEIGALSGTDPTSGGIYTYSTGSISLLPATAYYIIVTSATPITTGAFEWEMTTSSGYTSMDGWRTGGIAYGDSSDGSNWNNSRGLAFQFAVSATAVPEPSVVSLVGLGGLALALYYRLQMR